MQYIHSTLPWRHNGRDVVSSHQPHECLLNRSFMRRSKKTKKQRRPVNSPHKWPVTQKIFPCDDVIMIMQDINIITRMTRRKRASIFPSDISLHLMSSLIYISWYVIPPGLDILTLEKWDDGRRYLIYQHNTNFMTTYVTFIASALVKNIGCSRSRILFL